MLDARRASSTALIPPSVKATLPQVPILLGVVASLRSTRTPFCPRERLQKKRRKNLRLFCFPLVPRPSWPWCHGLEARDTLLHIAASASASASSCKMMVGLTSINNIFSSLTLLRLLNALPIIGILLNIGTPDSTSTSAVIF